MYHFIAKNLLLLAQHSWVGNLYIKFAEIADMQKKMAKYEKPNFLKNQNISKN